jgi:ribosomal protein L11 methyltransferase
VEQPIDLKTLILDLLQVGHLRRTPTGIVRSIRAEHPEITTSMIRESLRSLLDQGVISYSNRYSFSQLEVNYLRSIRISPELSINVIPGERPYLDSDLTDIYLAPGASFGCGDHPTTRLALEGVDYVLGGRLYCHRSVLKKKKALDIGTGSGVLAIAAAHFGVGSVVAIDTDPIARTEAMQNVILNKFQQQVEICEIPMESLEPGSFFLIMANLRPPTLKHLFPIMKRLSARTSYWVLSGFRPESLAGMISELNNGGNRIVWQKSEGNWSGFVVEWKEKADISV